MHFFLNNNYRHYFCTVIFDIFLSHIFSLKNRFVSIYMIFSFYMNSTFLKFVIKNYILLICVLFFLSEKIIYNANDFSRKDEGFV